MKFKSDIEVQAGLRDGSDDIGTAGQLLSSTGTITNWIDQADVVSAGATRVLIACKNTSGGTITKGTPVYQTGNVGATDVIEVAEADALISTGYLPAIGLLETDLINNAFGHVVITGELLNITTSPIDGVTPVTGDTIYLKSGGGLTLTKPTGEGNAIQNLGLVGKVSGGNSGSLTVSSIMRQNDVPNLPEGRIWIGDGNTIVSDTVYVDEPNNRVGIGTTTPSTVLEVSSTGVNGVDISQSASNASQSGRLFFTTNTASEGFALFNSNGTFQVNSGGIPNNTSGTNRISIIGSSGNVGIGTTSPSEKLGVFGNIRLEDGAQRNIIGPTNENLGIFANPNGSDEGILFSTDNGVTTEMIILNGGNVGIGTTSPGYKFTAYGSSTDSEIVASFGSANSQNEYTAIGLSGFIAYNGATKAGLALKRTGTYGTGELHFLNNNTTDNSDMTLSDSKMMINSSGNVGIGTTSPGGNLHVVGASGNSGRIYLSDKDNGVGGGQALLITKTGVNSYIYNRDSGDLRLGTNDQFSYVTIKPTGDVGIGTTSPSEKLEVDGNLAVSNSVGQLYINSQASSDSVINFRADSVQQAKIGWDDSNDSLSIVTGSGAFSTADVVVKTNGNVGIGTTSPNNELEVLGGGSPRISLRTSSETVGEALELGFQVGTSTNSSTNSVGIIKSVITQASPSALKGDMVFQTNSGDSVSTKMVIKDSGNVGIGTTSPRGKLDITNGSTGQTYSNISGLLIDVNGTSNSYYGLRVGSSTGNSHLAVTNAGNVGIGTTSPQEKVHVVEAVTGNTLLEVENTATNSLAGIKLTSGSNNYIAYTSSAGNFEIFNSQTGKVNFIIAANGQGAFGNAIDTTTGAAFSVGGGGGVSASKYINQRVVWATGFSHATNNSSAYYYFPVAGYLLTTTNQYYNGWIAPYAGRVKRITIRNVSGTSSAPTATTVNFRVSVNGSVIYTGANVTIVGTTYNKYAMEDIISSNADFVASDRIQVAFRTNGLWRNAAASISLEYTE